jgi:hypothetical protein
VTADIFHLTFGGFVECIFLWAVSRMSNERHFLIGKDDVIFFILIPCIIDYAETNQLNAPKLLLLYLLIQWLLHVSAKQCHPQGVTIFPF